MHRTQPTTLASRIAALAVMSLLIVSIAHARPTDASDFDSLSAKQVRQLIAKSVSRNDEQSLEAAHDRLWDLDPKSAHRMCMEVITKAPPHMKLIAAESIAQHADAETLSSTLRSLRRTHLHDERRRLVRAFGRFPEPSTIDRVKPYLTNSDAGVRTAALNALADIGQPEAVAFFVTRMSPPPAQFDSFDVDNQTVVDALNMNGAFNALTGLRPSTSADVSAWWQAHRRSIRGRTLGEVREENRSAHPLKPVGGVLRTANFDIHIKLRSEDAALEDLGLESWAELGGLFEQIRADALRNARPIFGNVHLPVLRVEMVDERTIASRGATSVGYGGTASRDRILILVQKVDWMERIMRHEIIHVIHFSQFAEQERWLMEGIGESLEEQRDGPLWRNRYLPTFDLDPLVEQGAVTRTIQWVTGASSGQDSPQYRLAHIVLEYLQYGDFAAPEARLAALMGRMNRGESAMSAIQTVYGKSVRELDEGLRQYLDSLDEEE